MTLALAQADVIAAEAHAGQLDKIGVPYIEHPRAVAAGLAPFGVGMQMAGLLHDVLEGTEVTSIHLRHLGVPESVITAVERVSKKPRWDYEAMIDYAAEEYASCLLKIADNAHNSHPDRTAQLPPDKRERLAAKYSLARSILWPAVPREDVAAILRIVNPSLLSELENLR